MKFEELGLRPELLRALNARGYTTATPVQAKAIPEVLDGYDILAGAQTGTGKTAAFALPTLDLLMDHYKEGQRRPRALVLTPTRELADQVGLSFRNYGKHLPLRTTIVYGGVGFNPQADALRKGTDILVATPGRLLDHLDQKTVDLSDIDILVLDEADRMLDMGFIPAIRSIMRVLPNDRQTLMFSATYNPEIRKLAESFLYEHVEIEVAARNTAAELVDQVAHPVAQSQKRALLSHLIRKGDWQQVLVFTRTKHGANRLAEQLGKDGITAAAIHGNKSQGARTAALADFKKGRVRVLVATDIASRGLDISQLPYVVNFELPNVPEDYVHRIGRTGRAGAEGTAVSLVSPDEKKLLWDIEDVIGRSIEKKVIEGFEAAPAPVAASAPAPRPSGGGRGFSSNRRRSGGGSYARQ